LSRVTVFGAGVIGLCCANELADAGFEVEVVDPLAPAEPRASSGNAGMIVPSHFEPLANPGAIKLGLKFLGDPSAPFGLGGWTPTVPSGLFKFQQATADAGKVRAAAPLLRDLNLRSKARHFQVDRQLGGVGYRDAGLVMLCQTEEALRAEIEFGVHAQSLGLQTEVWTDVPSKEPALKGVGGLWFADDACLDPALLCQKLHASLLEKGVSFRMSPATRPNITVLAAGAWTESLAGIRMPLLGGRGFGITLSPSPIDVQTGVIFVEDRLAMTQMPSGLRITGVLELGDPATPAMASRYHHMKHAAEGLLPVSLPAKPQWHGARPCSPDGLPYIGKIKNSPNTIVATGHGMMGLSLAAVTGEIVRDLALGKLPAFDLELMDPNRFA